MVEGLIEENTYVPTEVPSGNELIDATQNAIIGAAENVSEVLTAGKTMSNHAEDMLPFYADVEFWVGMAFILSVCVLARPLCKYIKKALQNRIQKVVSDIDEASKLRDDAQTLLAEYERKFRNIDKETKQIINQAEKNLQNIRNHETELLKIEIQNKEKETQRRIRSATQKAQDEINSSASVISAQLAHKAIVNYLQTAEKGALIDDAIAELDKFIA